MSFDESMRRVITGDNTSGKSVVILDGGPSSMFGDPNLGGLFEIWEDAASGKLDTRDTKDLGATKPVLGPRKGNVQVRWFVVAPPPPGVPKDVLDKVTREKHGVTVLGLPLQMRFNVYLKRPIEGANLGEGNGVGAERQRRRHDDKTCCLVEDDGFQTSEAK